MTYETECQFPILEKILDPETNKYAREHASSCMQCQDRLLQTEGTLHMMKEDQNEASMSDEMLESVSAIVDEYLKGDCAQREKILKQCKEFDDPGYFKLFQDLIYMIRTYNPDHLIPVPDHLTRYAKPQEKPKEYLMDKIAIRIKEGLQVLGSHLENVFTLSGDSELVPVRSGNTAQESSNDMLCFFVNLDSQKKVVYNIMKDHTNRVMLTVKLQNFTQLPKSVNLKENGKIISTYPMTKDYAYFSKVEPGDYNLELQYTGADSKTEILPLEITDK